MAHVTAIGGNSDSIVRSERDSVTYASTTRTSPTASTAAAADNRLHVATSGAPRFEYVHDPLAAAFAIRRVCDADVRWATLSASVFHPILTKTSRPVVIDKGMRRLARTGLVALALATPACATRKASPPEAREAGEPAGLTREQSAQVLARVGERAITIGQFVAALEHMDQFDRMRYQAPERRQELLGEMIDVMLLADVAREKGYDKDPVTQQEIREILRDAMLKKAREGLPGPSEIPEVEVRADYEAHRADFRDPERRRVSAVVLSSEGAATWVLEAAKKATPVQWGELVRAKSIDPRAKEGPLDLAGDMGFVGPPGDARGASSRLPEEVRAAVFEIAKVGGVLPRVVKSDGRYYVVRLASQTAPHDRSFEEAERATRVRLAQNKIHAKEEALIDELRKQYPVQIDEAALIDVRVALPRTDGGD
jgi:peptidyl-prolyl cis-trans isomerase C